MLDAGIIILGLATAAALLATALVLRRGGEAAARKNPYDCGRLRREMIASASSEEELGYLRELDSLELHRRHLVC